MTEASAITSPAGWTFNYKRVLNFVFWVTSVSGSIVFIEPSPYDFLILLTLLIWIIGGFSLHRVVLPFIFLLLMWILGGYLSLVPYWDETDPKDFMAHTLFIATTGIFYAMFFAENTKERIDICLRGYTISCVIASVLATVTWVTATEMGSDFTKSGRAMFPFKDPNVLGSYMVPGILYLIQKLLLGRAKYLHFDLVSLAIIATGLFLSFSRGSWGAAIISILLLTAMSLVTADSRKMQRNIIFTAAIVAAAAVIGILIALSNDDVREFFFTRAAVSQDYDEGPNGRFGNQLRSIPLLLERPNGFGPLRFRVIFDLDPHNAYVNAFASNGWLGGFAFFGLVITTTFIGFRGSFARSPYIREMQIVWAATFVFFLQAFQIDLDHWRMFYVTFGAVWGIEAARMKWLERASPGIQQQSSA